MNSKLTLIEKPVVQISEQVEKFIQQCWSWKGDDCAKHKRPNTQSGIMIFKNEVNIQKSYRLTGSSSLVKNVKYIDKTVDYTDHVFLCSKMAQLTRQFVRFKIMNNQMIKDIQIFENKDHPEGFNQIKLQPIKRKLDDWTSEISKKIVRLTEDHKMDFKIRSSKFDKLNSEILVLQNSIKSGVEYKKANQSYKNYLEQLVSDIGLVDDKIVETKFNYSEKVLNQIHKIHTNCLETKIQLSRKRNSDLKPFVVQSKKAKFLDASVINIQAINSGLAKNFKNDLKTIDKNKEFEKTCEIKKNAEILIEKYENVIEKSKRVVADFNRLNGMRKKKVAFLENYNEFNLNINLFTIDILFCKKVKFVFICQNYENEIRLKLSR